MNEKNSRNKVQQAFKDEKEPPAREKKRLHTYGDAFSCFPRFHLLNIFYIPLIIFLIAFAIVLIIIFQWTTSGQTVITGAQTDPNMPEVYIKDYDKHILILNAYKFTALASGIVFLLYSLVTLFYVLVLSSIMYSTWPWHYLRWNSSRIDANSLLVEGGVREKSMVEQLDFLNIKQKSSMRNHIDRLKRIDNENLDNP